MENFGAITYRETDMLIDPKIASVNAQKEVALVIAHEMAHQWFGDLVTMQWWDNIWLNEALHVDGEQGRGPYASRVEYRPDSSFRRGRLA